MHVWWILVYSYSMEIVLNPILMFVDEASRMPEVVLHHSRWMSWSSRGSNFSVDLAISTPWTRSDATFDILSRERLTPFSTDYLTMAP